MQFDDIIANGNEPVHLLTRYTGGFSGQFVYHCHKLSHEDEGMMELVEACEPGDTDCLCLDGETDDGECVTSNAGCYEDDTQCRYAEHLMASFAVADLLEDPTPGDELSVESRNDLAENDLAECRGAHPEFGSEAELIDYLATLTGLLPGGPGGP